MANYCEKCGGSLVEGAAHCQRCGAAVPTLSREVRQSTETVVEQSRQVASVDCEPRRYEAAPANPPEQKEGLLSRLLGRRGKAKDKGNEAGRGVRSEEIHTPPSVVPSSQTVVEPTGGRGYAPNDSPTVMGRKVECPYLIRQRTGEKLQIKCPAVVGKGSAASCLVSGNPGISRQHVRITSNSYGYTVENLSKTNGTWLDDMQLMLDDPHTLNDGARLTLADEGFTFHIG